MNCLGYIPRHSSEQNARGYVLRKSGDGRSLNGSSKPRTNKSKPKANRLRARVHLEKSQLEWRLSNSNMVGYVDSTSGGGFSEVQEENRTCFTFGPIAFGTDQIHNSICNQNQGLLQIGSGAFQY